MTEQELAVVLMTQIELSPSTETNFSLYEIEVLYHYGDVNLARKIYNEQYERKWRRIEDAGG